MVRFEFPQRENGEWCLTDDLTDDSGLAFYSLRSCIFLSTDDTDDTDLIVELIVRMGLNPLKKYKKILHHRLPLISGEDGRRGNSPEWL